MGEFDNSSAGSQDGGDLEEELQPVQLNTQAICVESIAEICAIIATSCVIITTICVIITTIFVIITNENG